MKSNSVKQIRVCLEEVAKIINDFIEEIIEDFKLKEAYKNGEEVEIQYRGIGLKGDFHEESRFRMCCGSRAGGSRLPAARRGTVWREGGDRVFPAED